MITQSNSFNILGVDPGTNVLGYGIVQVRGTRLSLVSMGVVLLSKYEDHYEKLHRIYDRTIWLIKEFNPAVCAIEAPFHGKNIQSMLKLGRAQGVAMAAAISQRIPVHEYSPKKIKQSVTGNGNASKEQVAAMLGHLLTIEVTPKFLDASDGLATAVCHYFQNSNPAVKPGRKASNWADFLKQNPDKLG